MEVRRWKISKNGMVTRLLRLYSDLNLQNWNFTLGAMYMYNRNNNNNDSSNISQFMNAQIPEEDNENNDLDDKDITKPLEASDQSSKAKIDEDFMFQMDKGNFKN